MESTSKALFQFLILQSSSHCTKFKLHLLIILWIVSMNIKKTELKVTINCQKCKTSVLKAVTKLSGVDEVKLDAEKGVLTVVGSVDPICVTIQIRKAGNFAEITSIGPPKKPDSPKKEPEKPKPKPCELLPPCCKQCQIVTVSHVISDGQVCSIL